MEQSDEWSERMVDLIRDVTDELPDEATRLFQEDDGSLERYLASESFFEDLQTTEQPLDVDASTFFTILFKQFHRRLEEDEAFRTSYRDVLEDHADIEWSVDNTRRFFEDEELIDYLVEMLDGFVRTEDVHQLPGEGDKEYRYIVDMLDVTVDASDAETFHIFCHIGNYSLYLTGVFPEWVQHRHEYKDRPMDVDSYRRYGKTYFERAASHKLARERELKPVLSKLHRGYDLVRSSLRVMFRDLTPASF